MKNNKNEKIKHLFDNLLKFYFHHIQGVTTISGMKWLEAALHFKDYAYERNVSGAAKFYRDVADKVLKRHLKSREAWRDSLEKEIWLDFKDECKKKGKKYNKKLDPLMPSTKNKINLVRFVFEIPLDFSIAAWAAGMLSQNKLRESHKKLKNVWGIGDKIASYYLRDIYFLANNLAPKSDLNDLYLLQPVDIWIRRASAALGLQKLSKKYCAEAMCKFEQKHSLYPGQANIGFWLLGSWFFQDEKIYRYFIKILDNNSLQKYEKNQFKNEVVIWKILGTFLN